MRALPTCSRLLLPLLAAVLCSIGGVCIKGVPWTPLAINGARNAIAACITGAFLWRAGHRLRWNGAVACGASAPTNISASPAASSAIPPKSRRRVGSPSSHGPSAQSPRPPHKLTE